MKTADIPRFFLYGEAPKHVGERFLHLESLDDRSRPAEWNIRPHTHANLSHIFYILHGGGAMSADAQSFEFQAPCLLVAPAGVVHGFAYVEETRGYVLTVSGSYFEELAQRCGELRSVFARAAVLPCPDGSALRDGFDRLLHELAWTAPGHRLSVDALLSTILVETLRLIHHASTEPRVLGPRAALVARFREQLEGRYRRQANVSEYAAALGVTSKQLRSACLDIADATPLQLIQDRLLLEAKRLLLYSNMTVAEAAFSLGYEDPAYFTRVFKRSSGMSPRQFRRGAD